MLTDEQLLAIKKRYNDLPPGEWKVEDINDVGDEWICASGHFFHLGDLEDIDACCYQVAEFIVHAHTDIPALVDEVEKLRNALQELWPFLRHRGAGAYISPTDYAFMREMVQGALNIK